VDWVCAFSNTGVPMTIIARRTLMFLATAVLLPCLAQIARADSVVTFGCGDNFANPCSGGPITGSGTLLSTVVPIGGLTTSILVGDFFSFSFNTADANSPLLTDGTGETLHGSIVAGSVYAPGDDGFGGSQVTFNVLWNLATADDVQDVFLSNPAFGGGRSTVNFSTINGATGGDVSSAQITIRGVSPVPEPGSIALLGTGLLFCGWLLRRRKQPEEVTSEIF
jgi:hypothetical protein